MGISFHPEEAEKRIAPAVVLRGPRQVGKTTLQLQMIEYLIREEEAFPTAFCGCNSMKSLFSPDWGGRS
jgi:predicted AAA+ superfamily ATPase